MGACTFGHRRPCESRTERGGPMGDGRWAVGGGRWPMGDGQWAMSKGKGKGIRMDDEEEGHMSYWVLLFV